MSNIVPDNPNASAACYRYMAVEAPLLPLTPPLDLRREFDWLDFSSTANPLGTPLGFTEAIQEAITKNAHAFIPDRSAHCLRTVLARKFGLQPDNFIVGTSPSSMIQAVAQTYAACPVGVALPGPPEHALAIINAGHTLIDLTRPASFMIPEPDMVRMYGISFQAAVLSNPGFPSSRLLPKSILLQYLESCTWVIVDERHIDLTLGGESYAPLVSQYPNLIVVQSLIDTYAMPGIPISYCIAHKDTVAQVLKSYDSSEASLFAEVISDRIPEEADYVEQAQVLLQNEIPWLQCMLSLIPGISVFPAESNYVLCEFSNEQGLSLKVRDTHELAEKLHLAGFLIRTVDNIPGLKGNRYFVVSIRKREENEKLVAAIKAIIAP